MDLASLHIRDKERSLEGLSQEAHQAEVLLRQMEEDLNLLYSDPALCEERNLSHLKSQAKDCRSKNFKDLGKATFTQASLVHFTLLFYFISLSRNSLFFFEC